MGTDPSAARASVPLYVLSVSLASNSHPTDSHWVALVAVNATNIGLNISGEIINIPVTGFGITPASTGSSGPSFDDNGNDSNGDGGSSGGGSFFSGLGAGLGTRRLLSSAWEKCAAPRTARHAGSRQRRRLQQQSANDQFDVALTLTKCGAGNLDGAKVSVCLCALHSLC